MDVSVIIPTHNKRPYLELTLESLLHQNCNGFAYEIIVVDDGSSDDTWDFVSYTARNSSNVICVRTNHVGRAAARNRAIERARGERLLFVDDDCLCPPNLILNHTRAQNSSRYIATVGHRRECFSILPACRDEAHLISSAEALGWDTETFDKTDAGNALNSPYIHLSVVHPWSMWRNDGSFNGPSFTRSESVTLNPPVDRTGKDMKSSWMFFVSCNCGVSRAAVIEVGGFDEAFTGWGEEDIELGYRLHNTGVTIVAVPDALVFHQQHVHNKSANAKSWARNYAYFVEKHRTLALYLRWQYLAGRISFDDFEKILIEYENGRLPSRDRMQIVCEYQAFLDAHSRDWPANEWVE